ncbi:class I SAM-dependent methyltransferase [Candidatus Roseilinea sp. NK_OTU-006]|jgi:SAM-dependent methyltransferase|nr:class I SAM-dependent methyltransferase [Candidatus Roseilinea sp. NK_OTU-006]
MRARIVRLALFVLGLATGATLAVRWVTRRAALITPPACAPLLLSPLRMAYRAPSRLLRFLEPKPDWTVLDLGCGNGAFTLPLARYVRRIHAVDVQPAMVAALRRRLCRAGLDNVVVHVAPATRLPFEAHTFDAVLMISVLPMLHDRSAALSEARRVLKPDGVLIVGEEWIEPEYVGWRTVMRWAESAGFTLRAHTSNPLCYTLKLVQRSEVRSQNPEVRGQKSESRSQSPEVRVQSPEPSA